MLRVLIAALAVLVTNSAVLGFVPGALACGAATDCLIGERTYRIHMPVGHDATEKVGAIVFMHGYRGTAAGIMRNKGLVNAASKLGLALIAPKSAGPDWDIPNAPRPGRRDELEFFDALIADVTTRFAIDPKRLMASGFSAGGMMVWNLACHRSELFAGFAPIAGTFWAPVPAQCTGVVPHLVHIHGTTDRVVPLKGRVIGPTRQGNVYRAIDMMRARASYGAMDALQIAGLACSREETSTGKLLAFCLHSGGHSLRSAYLTTAWNQLETAGAFRP